MSQPNTEDRYYVRIAVPATITLTVPVPAGADVKEIRAATQETLRVITDAEDQINLSYAFADATVDPAYAAVLHFDTAEEQTQDMKTIFTGVKKSRILDSFVTAVEVVPPPFAKLESFN